MSNLPRTLKVSIIACAIPGAIVALVATIGAWLQWGGLSFSNPLYYATLAVTAWCPVSKIVVWRLWRREVEVCPTCIPVKAIERRLLPIIEE
ncbi:MAG: hypothetical protein ACRDH2_01835 [Anaerolineales bacterium]